MAARTTKGTKHHSAAPPGPSRRSGGRHQPAPQTQSRRGVLWLGAGGATLLTGGATAFFLSRGQASGVEQAAGPLDLSADTVAVDRPDIDLGRVPLDKLVPVSVKLTNLSQQTVIFGRATAETLEGCWPPQPVVGSTTLKPGQSTTVSFSTSMHAGMDGPHLFRITVPTNHPKMPKVTYTVKALFG